MRVAAEATEVAATRPHSVSAGSRPGARAAAARLAEPSGNGRFRYAWGNNPKRAELKARACEVLARGALGSVLIRFENGQCEVVSRRALRRR